MSGLVGDLSQSRFSLSVLRVGFRLGTGSGKSCFRFNVGTGVEAITKSCDGNDTLRSQRSSSSHSSLSNGSVVAMLDEMIRAVCPSEVLSSLPSEES